MTNNIAWISAAGNGIAKGALVSQAQSNEKVFFQGRSYYLASLYQQAGVWQTFNQFSEILGTLFQNTVVSSPIQFSLSTLSYAAHALIFFSAMMKNSEISTGTSVCDAPYHIIKNEISYQNFHKLRQLTNATVKHAGNVIQAGQIAIAAFKFYQGFQVEAIASAALIGIGLLDRNNRLGQRVSKLFNQCLPSLSAIGVLVSLSPVALKLAAGAILINELIPGIIRFLRNTMDKAVHGYYITYGGYYPHLKTLASSKSNELSQDLDLSICKKDVEIDFKHLGVVPTLDVDTTGASFEDFKECFKGIDWEDEDNFKVLEESILNDKATIEYFVELFSLTPPNVMNTIIRTERSFVKKAGEENRPLFSLNPEKPDFRPEGKRFLIERARLKLALFVQNLEGGSRPAGDLRSIDEMKERALQVVAFLKYMPQETAEQRDLKRKIILELAMNGSDYSFFMMQQSINRCYSMVITNTAQKCTSLKTRLQQCLQQKRMEIVHTWYDRIQEYAPINFGSFLGFNIMSDVHIYNEFYSFIQPGLGLDESNIGQDRTVEYIPPLGYFVRTLFPYYRHAFFSPSPWSKEDAIELNKTTLDVMKAAMTSLKFTAFGNEEQGYFSRGWTLLKGIYTVPRDAFRLINATIFLYFEAIAGQYRYDKETILQVYNENLGKAFTQAEYDEWWEKRLEFNLMKDRLLTEKAKDPEKFVILMFMKMDMLKRRWIPREIVAFDLKSNISEDVTNYVTG
ncbi:MAG: hypothetical protein WC222_06805 [Parachlamydiales bacterium]|jgi:hypothetical protein